jgi:hypothetical protein
MHDLLRGNSRIISLSYPPGAFGFSEGQCSTSFC